VQDFGGHGAPEPEVDAAVDHGHAAACDRVIDAVTVLEEISHCQLSHANSMVHRSLLMPTLVATRVGEVNSNDISLEALLADEPMLTLPEAAERLGVVVTRVD